MGNQAASLCVHLHTMDPETRSQWEAALRPHVDKLKEWLLSEDGFLATLHTFFRENKDYFDVYQEEHALHYTTLHRTFADKFEAEIHGWLTDEGLQMEHLELMLHLGRE